MDKESLKIIAETERHKSSQAWAEAATWMIFWLFLFGCIVLTSYFKYKYGQQKGWINITKTVRELADVLHDCFHDDDKIDEYTNAKIGTMIRARVGSEDLKEYDELSREDWIDAWGIAGQIKKGKLKR